MPTGDKPPLSWRGSRTVANILLIEDHRVVRDALSDALESVGHTVVPAENGDIGLEEIAHRDVDIVVTDLLMPERDGFEVLKQLHGHKPELPVVVLSGGGSMRGPDLLEMARALKADVTLAKPVDSDELLAAVDYLMKRGAAPAVTAQLR
nr:response regulator [Rhodovibrio salinarum]